MFSIELYHHCGAQKIPFLCMLKYDISKQMECSGKPENLSTQSSLLSKLQQLLTLLGICTKLALAKEAFYEDLFQ